MEISNGAGSVRLLKLKRRLLYKESLLSITVCQPFEVLHSKHVSEDLSRPLKGQTLQLATQRLAIADDS